MKTEDKITNPEYNAQSQQEYKAGNSKKGINVMWFVLGILLIASTITVYFSIQKMQESEEKYSISQNENMELVKQLSDRDSVVNEWVETFNQIDNDLTELKKKEKIISLKSSDPELSKDKREEVLEDIRYINSLLAENKRRINDLNVKLKNSGLKITSLEKSIEDLNIALNERNTSIDSLKVALVNRDFQMAELNVKVEDMNKEIGSQKTVIENQVYQINKAYFAYGTQKELLSKGLITKEGGFLGIGKKENINFKDNFFKEINIKESTSFPLNAEKVQLMTEHPAGSYKLVEEDEKIAYLEITNPEEFWKISKYAVVEVN